MSVRTQYCSNENREHSPLQRFHSLFSLQREQKQSHSTLGCVRRGQSLLMSTHGEGFPLPPLQRAHGNGRHQGQGYDRYVGGLGESMPLITLLAAAPSLGLSVIALPSH